MNLKKILLAVAVMTTALGASAQDLSQMPQLPLDPAVRQGVLPNGLTYYIRHNAWPEERAYFYIAQKVGSMQEEDNQKGLAHFLEHMCFNGTTHFPGNKLKTYLESIGVKFGENLNAYTGFDETVYNIDNVKTTNEGSLDSCLLILHDWSHDLLLEGTEIDKERGVINEEWRMRRTASQRMYENALPEIYAGSKYANRMPIGTMDIVMNFPHDDLRAYYRKWYRPDLQAIVVVGDFDVDKMEQKIKTTFADIAAPAANAAERVYFDVPDNAEPIVSIQQDKEQPRSQMMLMWKHEAFPRQLRGTALAYQLNYMNGAISGMFSSRIGEILQKENAPFLGADMEDGGYLVSSLTKGAFTGVTAFKDNGQDEAVKALYREMLRARRGGFTVSEYERYKQEFLSQLEDMYSKRDKVYSSRYVRECVRHFLDNDAMPGIEWEYTAMKQVAQMIPLNVINQLLQEEFPENDSNLVIFMMAPQKDEIQLPAKQHLLDILHEVRAENIEPYKEEVNNDPLISETLKGSPVKSVKDDIFDSKLITLKNGIKIHVKKTDFTPNSISMQATSWGGTSLYSNDEYLQTSSASMVGLGGWGNFSAIDLQKKLSGIQASASPSVGDRTESIGGSCVTKDLETMLQLTYLCFTAPRKDTEAFNSRIERSKISIQNAEMVPTTALQDTAVHVLYKDNVRARRTRVSDLEKLNYDRILEVYRERFADGDDFEFFFIGDIDIDAATPLFEKYLGSLPVKKGKETYKAIDNILTKGEVTKIFEKEQETPNAITFFVYHAPMKETLENDLRVDMLQQLMSMLYTESVREDEGGAYGVPVNGGLQDYPEEIALMQIQLPTAPDKRERMTQIVYQGIDQMCEQGPKAEDLQKVKEYMHRSHAEELKQNGYWMNMLISKTRHGKDFVTDYDKTVDAITAADIQATAKAIFRSGNRIEVGMTAPTK